MTDQDIKKLLSTWKKNEELYLEEIDGYFLKVFLPKSIIEKIDCLIRKNNLVFSDFIADAEFAYLYQNKLQEHETVDISVLGNVKEFIDNVSKNSPYRTKEGFYKAYIPIMDDELCALYTFLLLEREKNQDFSMDDLFVKFVECFEKTDMDKIMELELSAYDEIGEEFEKRKH